MWWCLSSISRVAEAAGFGLCILDAVGVQSTLPFSIVGWLVRPMCPSWPLISAFIPSRRVTCQLRVVDATSTLTSRMLYVLLSVICLRENFKAVKTAQPEGTSSAVSPRASYEVEAKSNHKRVKRDRRWLRLPDFPAFRWARCASVHVRLDLISDVGASTLGMIFYFRLFRAWKIELLVGWWFVRFQ